MLRVVLVQTPSKHSFFMDAETTNETLRNKIFCLPNINTSKCRIECANRLKKSNKTKKEFYNYWGAKSFSQEKPKQKI